MALNLGKTKDWAQVNLAMFARLAERIDVEPLLVAAMVAEAVEDVRRGWAEIERGGEYPDDMRKALAAHLDRLPLLKG